MGLAISAKAADHLKTTNSQEFIVMEKIVKDSVFENNEEQIIVSNSIEN